MSKCANCVYATAKHDPYCINGIRYECKSCKSICFVAKKEKKSIPEHIRNLFK